MTYRNYARCMRYILSKCGIVLAPLVAFLGVYFLSMSDTILDKTICNMFHINTHVHEGLIRIVAILFTFLLIVLLGFLRKFRIYKDHKVVDGLFSMYPIIALGLSVFVFCNILNIAAGNTIRPMQIVRLTFHMLMVGAFEELLFRGVVQNILMCQLRRNNWIIAIFIQSLIFGICHLTNNTDPIQKFEQCFFSMMAGFFFGLAYYKTKSLVAGIFVHGLYDLSLNFYNCYLPIGSDFKSIDGLNWYSVTLAAILCVFLFILRRKYYNSKQTYTLKEVELELGIV